MLSTKQILNLQKSKFTKFQPRNHSLENAKRLIASLKSLNEGNSSNIQPKQKIGVLLRGGVEDLQTDDDARISTSFEKNFKWLFGVNDQPQIYGLLEFTSQEDLKTTLFVPERSEAQIIFDGKGLTNNSKPEHVDEVKVHSDLVDSLRNVDILHLNYGKTRETGNLCYQVEESILERIPSEKRIYSDLYREIGALRAIKTESELESMRVSGQLASEAHKFCIQNTNPGMTEAQVAQLFQFYCGINGHPEMAYPPICGSGKNAAILHYVENSEILHQSDLILCDMGVKVDDYSSDITTTYPIGGKFTQHQSDIYNLVLDLELTAISKLAPGMAFADIQTECFEQLFQGVRKLGMVHSHVSLEEFLDKNLQRLFMPHSLGHYLGLYTHDVGRCTQIEKENSNCSQKLAICKPITAPDQELECNMVTTVEPGIYFIPMLIRKYKDEHPDLFDWNKITEYSSVGGVRIEDNLVVREGGGPEFLTNVPRKVEEVERLISSVTI